MDYSNRISKYMNELAICKEEMNDAKKQMTKYHSILESNWQATESKYILMSIDKTISEIKEVINRIDTIQDNLKVKIKNLSLEE